MGTMQEAGAPLLYEPPPSHRARTHHRDRIDLLQPGRRRAQQHRGDGQGRQGRGHLVQVDSAGAAAVPPADDRHRRRLLHRPAEERRQGHSGTGTYPFTTDCHRIENGSPTTNVPQAGQRSAGHHQPVLRWTACRSSRWASTTSCRTSTIGAIRWSTPSAASSGRMSSSIRAR